MSKQWNIYLGLKIARLYLQGTAAYGFTRAVTWDYEGKREYYNAKTRTYEVKEKLFVDKAGAAAKGTFSAWFAWPVMLGGDLARLECAVMGRDAREYGGAARGVWDGK
jgi:hypothetical protein